MNIPKKVKIGAHIYKIKQVSEMPPFLECDKLGQLDRTTGILYLMKNLIPSEKAVGFFHETFHAMNGELSETLVDSLSNQIYAMLDDNNLLK